MGMYDESWCSGCGCSQPYSEDEVTCGNCTSEAYEIRSGKLIKYLELHYMSLNQDLEQISNQMEALDPNCKDYAELDIEYNWTSGQISATDHILSVASDMLGIETKEK